MKLFLTVLIVTFSFQSFSQTAYVNLMQAFEKTKQGQKIKRQLEKTANKAKAQFKTKELKLQEEEKALKKRWLCFLNRQGLKKFPSFSKRF